MSYWGTRLYQLSAVGMYNYANWMYAHDQTYRDMIDRERKEKEEWEARLEREEAELDARNPLMTKFTKKVIKAIKARKHYLLGLRGTTKGRAWCELIVKTWELEDLQKKYEARLRHYQGLE